MPLKSDKQVLLSELGSTFKQTILDNKDNSKDFKEIVELTETLERTRNLKTRTHIPKTTTLFGVLWDLPDDQFELIARMSRESFIELVKEIEIDALNPLPAHIDIVQLFPGSRPLFVIIARCNLADHPFR